MGALKDQPGVKSVRVDTASKKVMLDYDDGAIDLETISAVLGDEGYPVQESTPG